MSGFRASIGVLLSCVAGLLTIFCPGVIRCDVGANSLLSARCEAICLKEFNERSTKVAADQAPKRGTNFLEDCLKDSICSACVRPCKFTTISTRLSTCHTYCQAGEDVCSKSCIFLKKAHTTKPGACRAPEKATGFESACIKSCSKDGDCNDHLKCCSNGPNCGFTCQPPDQLTHDVPKIPALSKTTEKRDGKAVLVSWHSKESAINDTTTSPTVIYVLQLRHMLAVKPKWNLNTPWKLVTQTTRRKYLVRDVLAGHWYQFRVAAVVANGTNGFSEPTLPFRSSREVQAPSPPRNLSEAGFTVQDGAINLNVTWLAPLKSDLPIIRYKVYWSKRLSQITAGLVNLYVEDVKSPGNQTWAVIHSLLPDTTYFIQVEAIARHGDFRMKSLRVSELMTTYKIPTADPPEPSTPQSKTRPPISNLISAVNITAEMPFYQNSDVKSLITWDIDEEDKGEAAKYMITWKPVSCGYRGDERILADYQPSGATSHTRAFFTYGLQFGCHYVVKIRVVNVREIQGPVSEATFFVPHCHDIIVKGGLRPECPTLAEPQPPLRPRQLQHSVYVAGKNISVVIKWKLPYSDASIDLVKVTYGVIGHRTGEGEHAHTRKKDLSEMDKNSLKVIQLSGDGHRAVLETLSPDSVYAAEVRAVSLAGEGPAARLEFNTPSLPSTDQHDISQFGKSADEPRPNDEIPVLESRPKYSQVVLKTFTTTTASKTQASHSSTSSTVTPSSLVQITLLICITLLSWHHL